jgi:hypothetical protein
MINEIKEENPVTRTYFLFLRVGTTRATKLKGTAKSKAKEAVATFPKA